MKVYVDKIGTYEDDKYFRVYVQIGTHMLHSEKLNDATTDKLIRDLLGGKI